MLIGIDGNEANVTRRVGVSEFAYELINQFALIQSARPKFNIYLKDKPASDFPITNDTWKYIVFGPKKMWTQFALPARLLLERSKPDVFFTPSHYAPRLALCPTVVSIMDLAFIHFSQYFAKKDLYQLQNWTKYSVKNATKVITISEASKSDILKVYGLSPDKVIVIYPGIRHKKTMSTLEPHIYKWQEVQRKYELADKYLLFVSTLQPRKNVSRLIEAFSKIKATLKHDLQLIIVGKKGWLYEDILEAPEKFNVEKEVKFLDFVSDEDLDILYKNAQLFVYPSLYEGFGLPILEAMRHDCPVITSNVSSLPEAGGDAALYFDPLNVDDILSTIEKVLTDHKLREKMIAKGHEQVLKFSWEKAATQTLDILQQVGGKE